MVGVVGVVVSLLRLEKKSAGGLSSREKALQILPGSAEKIEERKRLKKAFC